MKRRSQRAKSKPPRPQKSERWAERVRELLPPEARDYVLRNPGPPVLQGARVNTLKKNPADIISQMRSAGFDVTVLDDWDDFLWVGAAERERLMESAWVKAGELYPQNASSYLAARLVDPRPGESVLDLCAAPGGKTTHLAAMMRDQGKILAVEPIRPRFYRLRENLRRMGVTNTRAFLGDGRFIKVPQPFDRALVDAPCSSDAARSLGDPETIETWSERKIAEMAHKQKGLLLKALSLMRPGGRLVYATCSLAPEENEAMVSEAIDQIGDSVALERPAVPDEVPLLPAIREWGGQKYPDAVSAALRVRPTERFGVFFVACFVRMA